MQNKNVNTDTTKSSLELKLYIVDRQMQGNYFEAYKVT